MTLQISLVQPPGRGWTLSFEGVETELQSVFIFSLVRRLEKQLASEPLSAQPGDPKSDVPSACRRCRLTRQVEWSSLWKRVCWEYVEHDSEDTVLKHAMLVCEQYGVELQLQ